MSSEAPAQGEPQHQPATTPRAEPSDLLRADVHLLGELVGDVLREQGGPGKVIVIAHSMGGLVARAYLRRYGAAKVARVLTIGSPHHGSVFASCFPGVCLAQMRLGNPWLARLNAAPRDPALRFVSLWSWHDSMVAPQTSSELPGAVDVPLIGIGHNALLGDAQVFAYALAEIVAARSAHTPDAASSGAAPGGQGQAG